MERTCAEDEGGMGDVGSTAPGELGSSGNDILAADDGGQTGLRHRGNNEEGVERSNNRVDFERMSSTRSFFVNGHQTGEVGEEYSNRADLERMMSKRSFPVDVGGGHAGHQTRRSSVVTNAAESQAGGAAVGANLHSDMVLDFFRQVNKDAGKLKRMGSDGVNSCGTLICRCFARCLAGIGLGNPAVSVDRVAFDKADPLRYQDERGHNRKPSEVHAQQPSGEFGMEEDWEEDGYDAVDAQALYEQKKKVHDLGELPALDWSYVSRNLLFCIIVCGALLLTTLSDKLGSCVMVGSLCLRHWCYGICVAVGSYFIIELLAKIAASFFKWTFLLHTNNKVWIFIKLHKEVSLLIWSVLLLILWIWFLTTKWAPTSTGVIREIIAVFVTYTAVRVVTSWLKVQMAHMYMWRPYVERAQTSIWSQYVIFMMTDHAMGVQTSDAEGQALALAFTKARKLNEHMSLYTVGKAINFVFANALRHPLGPGRPGTDKEGVINSKTGARLFGGLLYDALMIKFHEPRSTSLLPGASDSRSLFAGIKQSPHGVTKPQESALPRPAPSKAQPSTAQTRPMLASHSSIELKAMVARELPSVAERDSEEEKMSPPGSGAWTQKQNVEQEARANSVAVQTGKKSPVGGHHRRGSSAPWGQKGISLGHLRQLTKSKTLALQILDLFEVPPDGYVSRKVFIDRMVDIFVQRRSLQLTLGDYEVILKKAGYMLNVASIVIVFFAALRIFSYDVTAYIVTWLTLAVAFSFLFGSSASAFFESIIFIFVTKAYDVGDPVFFVDDTGSEDWYIVIRINLLTTVFRRWDGQATLLPNSVMAKKAIRNQWRSGPLLHHTMIAVSLDTPMERLDEVKEGITNDMRRGRHRYIHGQGGLMPDTVDYQVKELSDGNRLAVFFMCKQRTNGSNMGRRYANASLFLKLIAKECHRLGVTYSMPPQPITASKGALEVLRTREAFLGAEGGPKR